MVALGIANIGCSFGQKHLADIGLNRAELLILGVALPVECSSTEVGVGDIGFAVVVVD